MYAFGINGVFLDDTYSVLLGQGCLAHHGRSNAAITRPLNQLGDEQDFAGGGSGEWHYYV